MLGVICGEGAARGLLLFFCKPPSSSSGEPQVSKVGTGSVVMVSPVAGKTAPGLLALHAHKQAVLCWKPLCGEHMAMHGPMRPVSPRRAAWRRLALHPPCRATQGSPSIVCCTGGSHAVTAWARRLTKLAIACWTLHLLTLRVLTHMFRCAVAPAGVKFLLEEDAVMVGGSNHSHATQDLFDAIARGDYPEWALYIQTMDPAVRALRRADFGRAVLYDHVFQRALWMFFSEFCGACVKPACGGMRAFVWSPCAPCVGGACAEQQCTLPFALVGTKAAFKSQLCCCLAFTAGLSCFFRMRRALTLIRWTIPRSGRRTSSPCSR